MLRVTASLVIVLTHIGSMAWRVHAQSSPGALRIVVIEGEAAVNIVPQKTAVAPVVEVRDRNDQPVAGATVLFAIRAGRATFNGSRALTVTTNAAGRATATGLTPTGTGAVQIGASASFQGQTAAVTIAQTNIATGGISATAIGIIGGAAAGGTLAYTKLRDNSSTVRRFTGPLSWTLTSNVTNRTTGSFVCSGSQTVTGTLTLEMDENDGTITGSGVGILDFTSVATTCNPSSLTFGTDDLVVTGAPGSLSINYERTLPPGSGTTKTIRIMFSGALDGNAIAGSLTYSDQDVGPNLISNGSITVQVRLVRV